MIVSWNMRQLAGVTKLVCFVICLTSIIWEDYITAHDHIVYMYGIGYVHWRVLVQL